MAIKGKRKRTQERWVVIATLLIALSTLNFLASRHFARLDLTEQKSYTLSPSTKEILKGLDDIINIRLYFSSDLPPELIGLRRDVEDMLNEFKTYSKEKVQIEFHNPQQNPVEEQKVQMMGIPPVEVGVIKKDKQELVKVYMGLSIHFEAKSEVIPLIQNAQNLEYQLAAGIIKVTETNKPVLGWWGSTEGGAGKENYQLITDYLQKRFTIEYIEETMLVHLDPKKIPVLILLVPKTLSQPALVGIEKYLKDGGKGLIFVDRYQVGVGEGIRPQEEENPLEALLQFYGVKVEKDLVVDASNAMATFSGGFINYHLPYPFWVQIRPEGFNQEKPFVSQLNSLVLPWVSSISLLKDRPENVEVTPIFSSTPQAAKTESIDPMVPLNPDVARAVFEEGKRGSTPLGVLITQKNKGGPSAQLMVVGTKRLLQDTFLEQFQENVIFLENAVDTFLSSEKLIGIRTKVSNRRPIALLTDGQKQVLKIFGIFLSPVLLAALGFFIFWQRKRDARRLQVLWVS